MKKEPGIPQSMGSERVEHDLASEQQQQEKLTRAGVAAPIHGATPGGEGQGPLTLPPQQGAFHLPHTHTSTVFLGGAKFLRLGLKASFRVSLNISHVDDNDDNNGEDEAHLSSFPTTNSHMSGPDRELLMAL